MSAPGYSIGHFYNTATQRGFARTNLLRVKSIGDIFALNEMEDLLIYVKDGAVPSRNISVGKVKYRDYEFVVPMAAEYPENTSWAVTFYCDKEYALRKLFETWSRSTYDEHQHIQERFFNTCDVELVLLDNSSKFADARQMKEIHSYKLVGAFPVNVNQMQFNTGSSGEFVSLTVNIAYQYIISETLDGKDPIKLPPTPLTKLEQFAATLRKVGDFADGASRVVNQVGGIVSRTGNILRGFQR